MRISIKYPAIFFLLLLVVSCGHNSTSEIRIGMFGPMTGNTASFGQLMRKGIVLAVDEANAAGGIRGRKIALYMEDDRGNPEEAQNAVSRLITRERVVAVLGNASSAGSLAGGPICQQNRIPMLTPTATNPKVTQIGDCIFRVCWIDPFQARLMAKFAAQVLHVKHVAILYEITSDYSTGLTTEFEDEAKNQGVEILKKASYSSGDTDFSAQLTSIREENPEAIYIPAYYNEAGLIVRQARNMGIDSYLIGGDGWDAPQIQEIAGDKLDGTYYSAHFFPEDPAKAVRNFVAAFQAKYHEVPPGGSALSYDAAKILFHAIESSPHMEPAEIRSNLSSLKDYPGVTGLITIDAQRNAIKPAVVLKFENGMPTFVQRINP